MTVTQIESTKKETKYGDSLTMVSSTYGDDRLYIVSTVMVDTKTGKSTALLGETYPQDPNRDEIKSFDHDELRAFVLDLNVKEYSEIAAKYFGRII